MTNLVELAELADFVISANFSQRLTGLKKYVKVMKFCQYFLFHPYCF